MQTGFFFPIQHSLQFRLFDALVDEANLRVCVDSSVVILLFTLRGVHLDKRIADLANRLVFALHALFKGNLSGAFPVLCAHADRDLCDQAHLGEVASHTAVGNADLAKPVDVRSLLGIVGIHERCLVTGKQRRGQGEQEDQDDNAGCHNRRFALPEADPCILEIADRLVVELHVGKTRVHVDKLKLFGTDRFLIHVCHLISPPF